jgi:hypothetical protein
VEEVLPGGSSTQATLSLSDDDVCLLSSILEETVAEKYYLSPNAALGILDRAHRRGRDLPEKLETTLNALVETGTGQSEKKLLADDQAG